MNKLDSLNPSASGVLDQRLSLDVQGVDALRHTVRSSPQEGLKQASKQFEVLFMQMVLKSMRDATPSDAMFGSSQEKMYTSMLDQQLAQNLSGRGLGLAQAMFAQLNRSMGGGSEPVSLSATGTSTSTSQQAMALLRPPTFPTPLTLPATSNSQQEPSLPTMQDEALSLKPAPDLSIYETATAQATFSRSVLPQAHVEQFVSRLLPAAQRASAESGVPAQLIMAQAALESGWGRREILKADGATSYNLFGIKADKSWKGPTVETTTTEYVNGVAQKTRAVFRAYGSYEEAFSDYARFMVGNPRYAKVRSTQDPVEAAHGLQLAGYASDPQYGGKLIRIMKQMT